MRKLITSMTEGQKKQYKRFVEDAADKALVEADLDQHGLQSFIERGDEFQEMILSAVQELSVSKKYDNEQVPSNYAYPWAYRGPKPIADQIKLLAEIFNLDPSPALTTVAHLPDLHSFVPKNAWPWVDWFAVISDTGLIKLFPQIADPEERYGEGVLLVFSKIEESPNFCLKTGENSITRRHLHRHLRLHDRTKKALAYIAQQQSGDIMIIAAQLGMCHRGQSIRRAREIFVGNEYGLGSIMGSSIALIHPERFTCSQVLGMNLAGDEYSPSDFDYFNYAPTLVTYKNGLYYQPGEIDSFGILFASATAFLPS